jgi:hypothetical protein
VLIYMFLVLVQRLCRKEMKSSGFPLFWLHGCCMRLEYGKCSAYCVVLKNIVLFHAKCKNYIMQHFGHGRFL